MGGRGKIKRQGIGGRVLFVLDLAATDMDPTLSIDKDLLESWYIQLDITKPRLTDCRKVELIKQWRDGIIAFGPKCADVCAGLGKAASYLPYPHPSTAPFDIKPELVRVRNELAARRKARRDDMRGKNKPVRFKVDK